ncbi:hypothetical protein BAE44_0020053 [Dichanthelium oligosanthes]|uniref:NB-ARC domain-containing protein n=1 Tax=Dichanthelium oligosanthes TaxID=888268 RepID=A0A1E5V1G6_9POAL|nr:hypothetical protein BAE44_0020053 [Dichanthelium oligosanthes]
MPSWRKTRSGYRHQRVWFVTNSIRKLRELVSISTIADEIEELKNRVIETSDRGKRYKLDECISKDANAAIDPRLPALYADVGRLVGVDGPWNKIIKLLVEDDVNGGFGKQLKLVSIVGLGGLGKTSLANQVYQKIKGQFDCTCFAVVSQRPQIKKILVDLLTGLGAADSIWDEEQQLIHKIGEFLHKSLMEDHGRRYTEVLLSSIYQLVRQNLELLSIDYRGQEDFILDSSMGSCFALQRLQKLIIMKPLSRVPKWMSTIVNLTRLELYISRMEESGIDILKGISTLLFLRQVFTGHAPSGRIVIDGLCEEPPKLLQLIEVIIH